MAKLIMITGPQAVGKMTVGQELEKISNFKLFHNHMTIDLVNNFFSYSTKEGREMVKMLRRDMLEFFAKSSIDGIIFTYVVNYNEEDLKNVETYKKMFKDNNGEFYYVELNAPLDVRIKRNKSDNRILYKPAKRDIKFNTNISAKETAQIIKEKFNI